MNMLLVKGNVSLARERQNCHVCFGVLDPWSRIKTMGPIDEKVQDALLHGVLPLCIVFLLYIEFDHDISRKVAVVTCI